MNENETPSLRHKGDAPHPVDELLVAYLVGTALAPDERRRLDAHVRACDSCVSVLMAAHYRLGLEGEIAAPVPSAALERVRAAAMPPMGRPQRSTPADSWWSTAADAVRAAMRLPVLVPAAVAVGALLIIGSQQFGLRPRASHELTRGVELPHTLRVTAIDAIVRAQPSGAAETVTTLSRGMVVDIRDEERDWYRIALPDGTSGWVERRAFD